MSTTDLSGSAVAFDLDGTLIDTAPDLHRCLNETLLALDLELVSLDAVRHLVGHGARALIEEATRRQGRDLTPAELDRHTTAFIESYRSDIARLSRVFDGVETALSILSARGARLVVCTNKLTSLSVSLIDRTGLASFFVDIVGADAVKHRKPHPDHFIEAIRRTGMRTSDGMMVGDSINDVLAARAAGAPVVVTSFGYTDTPAAKLGADAVFSSYAELPGLTDRLLGRRTQ